MCACQDLEDLVELSTILKRFTSTAQQCERTLFDYCIKRSKQQTSDKGDDGTSAPQKQAQQAEGFSG